MAWIRILRELSLSLTLSQFPGYKAVFFFPVSQSKYVEVLGVIVGVRTMYIFKMDI